MKGGVMKRCLLSLLCMVGILLITCGNEPPEDFYTGTPEDSTAIHQLLNSNPDLLVTEDMFDSIYTVVDPGQTPWYGQDSFFRNDSTIIKQHIDSCALKLSSRSDTLDFWFAKDTTCTVKIIDTFTVISEVHYDTLYTGYYFWPPDTMNDLDTVIVDTVPGERTRNITGNGLRMIFFDPVRELVEDPETGDSVWAVSEPIEWQLKRISYGTYNFPAPGTDTPDIDTVFLERTNGDIDTIIASSYDTTYTGHVMNRFRSIDSLLQCRNGETLGVTVKLSIYSVNPDTCLFFASCAGANRVELDTDSMLIVSGTSGSIVNIYFEAVIKDMAYFYVQPEKEYTSQVWLLPVKIE